MNEILGRIVEDKRERLSRRRYKYPLAALEALIAKNPPARDFAAAVSAPGKVRIIGEIKRASPSAGFIRTEWDVPAIARSLQAGEAAAVSVITEEKYFHGDLYSLVSVKEAVSLPVLRKDFIVEEYQVFESRAFCADAVLLIVSILTDERLAALLAACKALGMSALVETHTEEELKRALGAGAGIIGVNNRDLSDFSVDFDRVFLLKKQIPAGKIVVCESGINSAGQILRLKDSGINAALVGESLMRAPDIASKLKEFTGHG